MFSLITNLYFLCFFFMVMALICFCKKNTHPSTLKNTNLYTCSQTNYKNPLSARRTVSNRLSSKLNVSTFTNVVTLIGETEVWLRWFFFFINMYISVFFFIFVLYCWKLCFVAPNKYLQKSISKK